MAEAYEMTYSLEEIERLTQEELIWKSQLMEENYQQTSKPAPADVKGLPTWLDIHGEKRYCLHYPSRNRKNGPVLFDIHGGGFIWGSPEEDDLFCARVNEVLDVEIYSLEYPRTAAHPYPEAAEELYDTICFMTAHAQEYNFDPDRVAIGGHSAGGTLTGSLILKNLQEKKFRVKCQYLAYPAISMDFGDVPDEEFAKDGLGLSRELLAFFNRVYAPDPATLKEKGCMPALAGIRDMEGIPPTVIMLCAKDVIRFQGRAYAAKLIEANVEVLVKEFADCPHGFEVFPGPHMQEGQDFLAAGIAHYLGI